MTALPQGIRSPLHVASVIPWSICNSMRGTCLYPVAICDPTGVPVPTSNISYPRGHSQAPCGVGGPGPAPCAGVAGNQATSHGRGRKTATGGFWLVLAPAWRQEDESQLHAGLGGPGWARVSIHDTAGCQGGVHCLLCAVSAAQSIAFPRPVISGQGLCCATTFEMSCAGPIAPGAQLPPR